MVRFIKQEAEEKANEIRVSAEEVRGAQHTRVDGAPDSQQTLVSALTAGVQLGKAAVVRAGEGQDPEGV
jgi:hypothetical protein